ncbi:sec-independent protein translocase protein TATA, chloroplastic [Lycium ferocissimum]|uniref:sec-independent protein translocase protein TATA, chloroplastic n=1 Tax=Lycium ferocissimum TaxID=112874 RepID=UPI0028165D1D|nr:sec-independent protein translocase protein TATA, chloroplastic [Lycium ferocissimum]
MAIISSSAIAATTLSLSLTPKPISSSSSSAVSTAKIPTLCSSSSSLFFNSNRALFMGPARKVTSSGKRGLSCKCLFGLGVPELAVIAGVAALVFGPKQLPEVGRTIGKTVKSFQQAAKEFETELKKEPEPPVEKAIEGSQEEKQDAQVASTNESS